MKTISDSNPMLNQEFIEWANGYFAGNMKLNCFLLLNEVFGDFHENTTSEYWSLYWFRKTLKLWCQAREYELNPPESLDENGYCKDPFGKGSAQYICIKAPTVEIPSKEERANHKRRQLIEPHFKNWADSYFRDKINVLVPKIEAMADYERVSNFTGLTSQKFKEYLKAWSDYHGYTLNPVEQKNSQGRMVFSQEGKTVEMVFIQKK